MRRFPPHGIEPGPANGLSLRTVDGTTQWAQSGTGDLSDVDTVTTPPGDGDLLAWDAAAGKWVPYTVPAATRLVPLTTTVGGVPELVWDDDDNLVMAEATQ